jgi:23S rRNA (pseudouridine1915-N3)-methyltransferase
MFKITIIVLGKLKEKAYIELEKEYIKRLSPFAKIKIIELPEVSYGKNPDLDKVKTQEAEKIVSILPKNSVVILLEESGTLRDSKDFSKFLERTGSLGKELVFVDRTAALVNQKLSEILKEGGLISTDKVAILACMNLASELLKLKEENEQIKVKLKKRLEKVLINIDTALTQEELSFITRSTE